MAANYFMLTKDGRDLSGATIGNDAAGIPVPASGALALSDVEFTDTFASGLGAWSAYSFNVDTDAENTFLPTVVSGRVRTSIPNGVSGYTTVDRDISQGWGDVTVTAEVAPTAALVGQNVWFNVLWSSYPGDAPPTASVSIQSGRLWTEIGAAPDYLNTDHGAYNPTAHRWVRFAEKNGQIKFSVSLNRPVFRGGSVTWIRPR